MLEQRRSILVIMRRLIPILLLSGVLVMFLMAAAPVLGGSSGDVLSQTWPSRTPTPVGPQPSPNPPATQPPPGQTPTATVQPGSTPEATSPPPGPGEGSPGDGVTEGQSVPGPEPRQWPSAAEVGDCGLPPIAIARGPVNVRSGPGIEFQSVEQLQFNDERVIVGRAAAAAWWQILLNIEGTGWVSDQAVVVAGYIGAVPVAAGSQAQNGEPGWDPTPNPTCEPPSSEEITANVDQLATAVLAERPSAIATPAISPEPDQGVESGTTTTDSSPVSVDEGGGGLGIIWLPIAGVFLIVAGGIAFLVQRRQR
jgi:hypothetical protein